MGIPKIAARAGMPTTYVALLLWSDDGHKANRAPAKTRLWRRHIPTCRECVYGRAAIYRAPPSLPLVCRSRRRSKMPLPSLRPAPPAGKTMAAAVRLFIAEQQSQQQPLTHRCAPRVQGVAAGVLKLFPDFAMILHLMKRMKLTSYSLSGSPPSTL